MLWLDTFVLVKLAKLTRGENLQLIERQRLERLRTLVKTLVRSERLLCPQADQDDEYQAGRLALEIDQEWLDLSCGVRMLPLGGIQDNQTHLAIDAYCESADEICVPWQSSFAHDPFGQLAIVKQLGFAIGVRLAPSEDMLQYKETVKLQLQNSLENIRQRDAHQGRSYDDIIQDELEGFASAHPKFLKRYEQRKREGILNEITALEAVGTLMHLERWREKGGEPPGIDGLVQCMRSPFFTQMPVFNIYSKLLADLVTDPNRVIKGGDSMDVNLLSAAIPISHFILCDKDMRERIRRRRIDTDWNTKVYTMPSIDDLFDELGKL